MGAPEDQSARQGSARAARPLLRTALAIAGTLAVVGSIGLLVIVRPWQKRAGSVHHCPEGMIEIRPQNPVGIGSHGAPERVELEVTLSPYCIDRTEVTVADYARCVAANAGCKQAGTFEHCNPDSFGRRDHPVNCVDWYDANAYCNWASTQLLGEPTWRLPTEEEWEYAARGPQRRPHVWGGAPPRDQLCWDGTGSDAGRGERKSTCPVGAYPNQPRRPGDESVFGVLDMAGNVCEWMGNVYCWPQAPRTNGNTSCPVDDEIPIPERGTTHFAVRGAAWNTLTDEFVTATWRMGMSPDARTIAVGFRCARSL